MRSNTFIQVFRHVSSWHGVAAALAGVSLAAGVAGCSNARVRYYFAAADLDSTSKPQLTFYRATISGESLNVKSSFQTGFYDANALHQLFGTVSTPSDASKTPLPSNAAGEYHLQLDPATGTWRLLDHNERFTVIYGANADAISQQIQLFAESDQTGENIGRILAASAAGSEIQAEETGRQKLNATRTAADALAKTFNAQAASLDSSSKPKDVKKALVTALQDAVKRAGSNTTLDNDPDKAFADAQKVYDSLSK